MNTPKKLNINITITLEDNMTDIDYIKMILQNANVAPYTLAKDLACEDYLLISFEEGKQSPKLIHFSSLEEFITETSKSLISTNYLNALLQFSHHVRGDFAIACKKSE